MELWYVDVHVVPGTEYLLAVLAGVWELPSKVDVLHVFDGAAPVAVHLVADCALDSPGSRSLLKVTGDHRGHVFKV